MPLAIVLGNPIQSSACMEGILVKYNSFFGVILTLIHIIHKCYSVTSDMTWFWQTVTLMPSNTREKYDK